MIAKVKLLFIGLLILVIPLMLVELSRQRDWLMGGLFLFLALFISGRNFDCKLKIHIIFQKKVLFWTQVVVQVGTQNSFYQMVILLLHLMRQ